MEVVVRAIPRHAQRGCGYARVYRRKVQVPQVLTKGRCEYVYVAVSVNQRE